MLGFVFVPLLPSLCLPFVVDNHLSRYILGSFFVFIDGNFVSVLVHYIYQLVIYNNCMITL